MSIHVQHDFTEDGLQAVGRERGLRLALGAIFRFADDAAQVKAYKELNGEPSEAAIAKELEQFRRDFRPESTLGEAFSAGFRESVEHVHGILREDLLGHP